MIPISILLVDENLLFNDILTHYFADVHGDAVTVIGSATASEEAYFLAHHLRPNLILHDLGLPGLRGVPSMRALRRALPQVGLIALTLLDTPQHRNAAIEAGADEIVYKGDLAAKLETTIHRVCEKRLACAPHRAINFAPASPLIH